MKKSFQLAALALAVVISAGCTSYEALIENILPANVDSVARSCIQDAADGKIDQILDRIPSADRTQDISGGLQQLSAYMQKGKIVKLSTAGVQANTFQGMTTYSLTYEIQYPEAWQVANVVLTKRGDVLALKGLHVNDIPDSLVVLNRFTFKGKGSSHFLFFGLNVVYIAVVVSAFVLCLRTRHLRKKWLWAIISLAGIVEFGFNWTTGEWGVKPLSIGLKISTFVPPYPYMPSILYFYIPVGALAFLARRASMKTPDPAESNLPEGITNN